MFSLVCLAVCHFAGEKKNVFEFLFSQLIFMLVTHTFFDKLNINWQILSKFDTRAINFLQVYSLDFYLDAKFQGRWVHFIILLLYTLYLFFWFCFAKMMHSFYHLVLCFDEGYVL